MLEVQLPSSLGAALPPETMPGIEEWRLLVQKTLEGRGIESLRSQTRHGIPIEPLYARRSDTLPLLGRGARRWVIVQPVDDPDPDRVNERAKADIEGGATGLSLHFSSDSSTGARGLPMRPEALRVAFEGIDLAAIHLRLDPHEGAIQTTGWLKNLILASGLAPERADVAFGLDPLSALAAGEPPDRKAFAAAFHALRDVHFRGPLAILDARPFHEAGATEAQELAVILGAAAWWLRALDDDAGIAPEAALPLLGASLSVDRDVLLSIAKLRALRLLWARLQEVCSARKTALQIHAETSRRMLTRTELLDNLLRNTLAAFAAGIGGADAISVVPHTAPIGIADRNARALARNIQHLLMEESQLHWVADPAAGSGAIEALTEALAERAWNEFHAIERDGGIVESLTSGAFEARSPARAEPESGAAK